MKSCAPNVDLPERSEITCARVLETSYYRRAVYVSTDSFFQLSFICFHFRWRCQSDVMIFVRKRIQRISGGCYNCKKSIVIVRVRGIRSKGIGPTCWYWSKLRDVSMWIVSCIQVAKSSDAKPSVWIVVWVFFATCPIFCSTAWRRLSNSRQSASWAALSSALHLVPGCFLRNLGSRSTFPPIWKIMQMPQGGGNTKNPKSHCEKCENCWNRKWISPHVNVPFAKGKEFWPAQKMKIHPTFQAWKIRF